MNTLREAAEAALEALEALEANRCNWKEKEKALSLLRAALAEPVQEPVALGWLHKWANHDDGEPETQWHEGYEAARRVVQIHLTAPPQRKPLTEEEIEIICKKARADAEAGWPHGPNYVLLTIRAIERAHGIGGQDESA